MRVTFTMVRDPSRAITLIDGSWLNHRWLDGEIRGLEKQGIDGWYDSLAPRDADPEPIPQQDGSYWPLQINLSHRVVTLRGVHRGSSSLQVARFRDELAALVGEPGEIRVEDTVGVRTSLGYVSSQIPVTLTDPRTTRFSLIAICPDPLKYGPEVVFRGDVNTGIDVVNAGTAPVFPRLVITGGPLNGARIQLGGQWIEWRGDDGYGLSIDMADGIPMRDGVPSGVLLQDDFFQIPPGRSHIQVVAPTWIDPPMCALNPGWK